VAISYSAVGSSAGIAAFSARRVDFGASDVPLNAAEQAAAHGGGAVQVPVDLGAAFVVYNLVLPGTGRLRLSGPVIARIFLGQITRWNDPAIVALNPGADIPDVPVNVVHRSDGSGTTYIFSNYLSAVDPAWASRIGTGKSLHWPVGVGARGNPGVAQTVAHTPFSIGYIERSYSKGPILNYAAIRNQAGNYTTPSTASITAAAAQKPGITRPTSRSSTSLGLTATPSAGTAGRSSTSTRPARPPGKHSSPSWTGSPIRARPMPPRPATCPSRPESRRSLAPCSGR